MVFKFGGMFFFFFIYFWTKVFCQKKQKHVLISFVFGVDNLLLYGFLEEIKFRTKGQKMFMRFFLGLLEARLRI